ncbi:MAG TPA: hypothetical protein DIV86_07530 [Alphaproteobacteria bacterium]|nr:hypothetical protein [Alphaproteobacteria bacterium]
MANNDDGGGFFLIAIFAALFAWFSGWFSPKKNKEGEEKSPLPELKQPPEKQAEATKAAEEKSEIKEKLGSAATPEVPEKSAEEKELEATKLAEQNFNQNLEKAGLTSQKDAIIAASVTTALKEASTSKTITQQATKNEGERYKLALLEAAKNSTTQEELNKKAAALKTEFSIVPEKVNLNINNIPAIAPETNSPIQVDANGQVLKTNQTSGSQNAVGTSLTITATNVEVNTANLSVDFASARSAEIEKVGKELLNLPLETLKAKALTITPNSPPIVSATEEIQIDFGAAEKAGSEAKHETQAKFDEAKDKGKEEFKQEYKENHPTASASLQLATAYATAGNTDPLLGGQVRASATLLDKTNLEQLSESTTISGRTLELNRKHIDASLSLSQRSGAGRQITGLTPDNIGSYLSYARLLDANVTTNWNINSGNNPSQVGLKIGPSIYFNPTFESYNLLYPGGLNRCPCTGVCTIENTKIPLATGAHAMDIWKFPEYGQIAEARFKLKDWEFSAGYKPKNLNLDQPFVDRIMNLNPSSAQMSETFTGSVFKIGYGNDGKENNTSYLSTIIRPGNNEPDGGVSRLFLGNIHKTDKMLFETQIDLASARGNPAKIALGLLDAGVTIPLLDKYGVQNGTVGLSGTLGKSFVSDQTYYGLGVHGEWTLLNKPAMNMKLFGGARLQNYDGSTILPPESSLPKAQPNFYIGIQTNFTPPSKQK